MTPKEQLEALGERLMGLIGKAYSTSRKIGSGDLAENDRVEGTVLVGLVRRAEQLHKDYAEFLRAQVEAAKPKTEVKK